MHYTRMLMLLGILCCGSAMPLFAQTAPCGPDPVVDTSGFSGTAFFNYGSNARLNSQKYRSAVAVGQTFVGYVDNLMYNSTIGFYARYLLPPFALKVKATQGDLLDRIQISWEIDALGPSPNDGFNIYRDGIFLATVGSNIRNYNDFNVIPGIPYNYTVRGLNIYGEGAAGTALGFQVPNGVVTGWVQTLNGNPVPDAMVTLMPMQGFSAKFGPTDGAFAPADTSGTPFMPPAGDDWTMTFWIKTDVATANAGLIQLTPFPLYIRALNSAGGHEGIDVSTTQSGTSFLSGTFADSTKNGWHHVALSFEGVGGQGRLYIDGVLVALAPMLTVAAADELNIGSRTGAGGWTGRLDELRIYTKQLDELDFREVMEGTASTLTPNLSHYWKMDEAQGVKSYDIMKRQKLYFCGAAFDAQRPPVRTSGKTNDEGYYRIESASYGTGTTFLAEPMKAFYMHRSLKMVRSKADYATLSDFSVTPKATLELWVNSAGPNGEQCLLSKKWPGNDFRLLIRQNGLNNQVWFYFNGQEHNFGNLGMGYQHLAFTMTNNAGSQTVTAYKNGVAFGAPHTFSGITGNWSDPAQEWVLGARPSGGSHTDYFGGLIDEVALYDTTLSVASILNHSLNARDMQGRGLRVYFAVDEGNGVRLNNSGSAFLTPGVIVGAEWSPFAANQSVEPHVFSPATRQVTLNPSVTSVDQVDFIDRSTIAVSGFVRYKNTDCFAKNVEILVNGASFSPKILTDSTGKFVIDFDPGATARLTPKFENHVFTPAFWDINSLSSPVAGVLFNDITTRKISGQVAGGLCKKSIIKAPPAMGQGTFCVVKVRSVDGCLERIMTLDNQEGNYEFDNLPPLESLTVAVTEHSDPEIKAAFQVLGGSTVNLAKNDTILDFIYFAAPEVEIVSGLDPYSPSCNLIVLDEGDSTEITLKLKEQYVPNGDNGVCYLDTADFRIINGLADTTLDRTMSGGSLKYKFRVGTPNPSPPFLKTLQILGTSVGGREGSLTVQAVVTGIRNKLNTFTTQLPETPTLILRDPPGDRSYSFLEKGEKICNTTSITTDASIGTGGAITVHGGVDQILVTAPLGIGTIQVIDSQIDALTEGTVTYQTINSNSFQTCASFNHRISTNADELIVGAERGGDVYMGIASNIIFGFADLVSFNDTICQPEVKVVLNVVPGDFPTTFIYSEWNIQNNIKRYLATLASDPNATLEDIQRYNRSIIMWDSMIAYNAQLKNDAKPIRNLSYDALVSYEYSETSGTISIANHNDIFSSNRTFETTLGAEILGSGVTGTIKFETALAAGGVVENGEEKGVTTGYVLGDNDPGDYFTVDVGMDSVFKTPVFELKAGQSSCPWEPGTANREGPNLQLAPGSQFTAVNVPATEPAVFQLKLGNLSASNEDWTYGFTSIAANNPNGAVIKLNGQPLNYTQKFIVPYGTSQMVTLTVERGPLEYDYDSLMVALYSECEYERHLALSIPLASDPNFFSPIYLGVHFIRPCSEVNINVPEQNWAVINNDPSQPGTLRRITVSGYDLNTTDFKLVRVQYRRSDGDGAWINIPGISDRYNPNWSGYAAEKLLHPDLEDLQSGFTQFYWETAGLSDGPYEIHAWAVCTGDASDKPGYSQIIKGRIDREPPSLVGNPQPSDGVYNVGDEISFTFNKHINCNKLIPADLTQPNNVALFDATTGLLIGINATCFENRIVIDPNFQNAFFENRILRAELHDIEDLAGNQNDSLLWEFYVDRNELAWLTDSLGMTKYEDQTKSGTADIHNRGGYPVPFKIQNVPDWVHVVPNQGTLAPNEIRPVHFTVDSTLAFGLWSDSITLHTETGQNPFFMGGDEGLPFGVRVVCRPPNWNLNANIFENSENMVLELNIQGETSTDVEDIIVAYIGDSICGRGYVQFVPQVNKYLAYLTIYGNPTHILAPIRLEIWDASACLRYAVLEDYFTFQPDNVIGNPVSPQVVHTSGYVLRDVPLGYGWNWLSFNLAFPDPDLDAALMSLHHPEGDLLKGQNAFSTYLSGGGWLGSLDTLGNKSMYIYRANVPDTLRMLGNVLDPATTPIPLVTGWNWIGYIPNYSLPLNDALASLPAQTGDLVKSQVSFAQYISPDYGWIGNLKFMQPPNGYQIKLAAPGTLVYPPPSSNRNNAGASDQDIRLSVNARGIPENVPPVSSYWNVDPTQFEYSMTLIGMLKINGLNATTATMELGVFSGNQLRGSAQAIYIAPMQSYCFFLTTYANTSGEQLRYKLFDSSNGTVQDLNEQMYFSPDLHQGSIELPVPFTLGTTATNETVFEQSFDVQPNPFHAETMFRFSLSKSQEVKLTVTNTSGKTVAIVRTTAREGLNTLLWKGQTDTGAQLGAGVYFVRLQTEAGSVVRKVVLQ